MCDIAFIATHIPIRAGNALLDQQYECKALLSLSPASSPMHVCVAVTDAPFCCRTDISQTFARWAKFAMLLLGVAAIALLSMVPDAHDHGGHTHGGLGGHGHSHSHAHHHHHHH